MLDVDGEDALGKDVGVHAVDVELVHVVELHVDVEDAIGKSVDVDVDVDDVDVRLVRVIELNDDIEDALDNGVDDLAAVQVQQRAVVKGGVEPAVVTTLLAV